MCSRNICAGLEDNKWPLFLLRSPPAVAVVGHALLKRSANTRLGPKSRARLVIRSVDEYEVRVVRLEQQRISVVRVS